MTEDSANKTLHWSSWLFVTVSLSVAFAALSLLPEISSGTVLRYSTPWVPSLGVNLSFMIDGLSLLFGLLIGTIGIFVGLYAGAYMRGHPLIGRLFLYLLLFQASMLGLVLADNIIALFVFWELTTIASYLLIGFEHQNEKARRNAWQALLVTGAGGLFLLVGLLLLGTVGGSMELSELIRAEASIQEHPWYGAILALILIGAFTKSAQIPFHFWLPNAMAAPTPISAYLHSATMVKAGIYLLARLHPALAGTPEWIWTLTIVGAVTAVWASLLAVRQTDLKLALAYTTVMALGTLTMFLGSEARIAIAAAITFLLVHSLYKCALFLVVGIIDHETGTRDAGRLGGLSRAMPMTTVAAALAALSMAGFPPFLGFIGKELKYEGALAVASEPALVAAAAVFANALMVAVAGIVAIRPFFRTKSRLERAPHEPPVSMWIGPLVLACLGLVLGVVPPYVAQGLVQPAVSAVLGEPETVKLALWHGLNLPLLLSVLTLLIGLGFYRYHRRLGDILATAFTRIPVTGDKAYDWIKNGVLRVASAQTAWLQNGSLRRYLFVVFSVTAIAGGATLIVGGGVALPSSWPSVLAYEWGILALITVAAVLPVVARTRFTAICGLGAVGTGIALIFLIYGAPDVAITQLLVEILFVVMISVVLLKLPRFVGPAHSGRAGGIRDLLVAGATGAMVTLMLLAVLDTPISDHVTRFFEANSVPEGHGRNIVNVILVDFRALDTLGEIIVVVVAALGAYALIKVRAAARRSR